METAGFILNPQAANPGLKENLVFTAGAYGYPITFENWEQAYLWIDGAELRDTPGLREQVQHILHPEPQNGGLTNEDYAAVRGTLRERTSYDPAVPPYHVGDTVYLDDRPHQITELRDDTVQLLPTGMSYPIYRAESRERFEQLLREDNRNDFYTEFLPANLDTVDQDLRDVLAHGLIGEADKAELSELLRNGKSNREIGLWLSRAYPDIVETMELETGETADYRTMPEGIELEVLDADEKRLAMLFFQWSEVAPLLRGMYTRQLDGFGQEHPEPAAETPAFQAETVAVYLQRNIEVNYSSFTAERQITGKSSVSQNNVAAYTTYETSRANAYKILEDSLNLRDVRIYDTVEDADGKERRVLNAKETTLAAQKQQAIRDAFNRIWALKN